MDLKPFNINYSLTQEYSHEYLINGNVLDKLEDFIIDNLLKKYDVIINSQWRYLILIDLSDAPHEEIFITEGHQVKSDKAKYCNGFFTLSDIKPYKDEIEKFLNIVKVMLFIIKLFFKHHFKKLSDEILDKVFSNLELGYLFDLNLSKDEFPDKIFID